MVCLWIAAALNSFPRIHLQQVCKHFNKQLNIAPSLSLSAP